jgi:hypothetical protein
VCWFIEVTVVLENSIPSVRNAFREPKAEGPLEVNGSFPTYEIVSKAGCACDLVDEDADGLMLAKEVPSLIEGLIEQEPVKRLHLCFWWGSPGEHPDREEARLDWPDFKALNNSHRLRPDVEYRITSLAKYAR